MNKMMFAAGMAAMLAVSDPLSATEILMTNVKVRYIQPEAGGAFYVSFTSDDESCLSTASPKRYYVRPGQKGATSDGAKNILATAMTALIADRLVNIRFDDSDNDCSLTRVTIF